MCTAGRAVSTWAPLGVGIFRALWLASLVSNIGTWMQTVGAQWLLVQQPQASILVALGVLAVLIVIYGFRPFPLAIHRVKAHLKSLHDIELVDFSWPGFPVIKWDFFRHSHDDGSCCKHRFFCVPY